MIAIAFLFAACCATASSRGGGWKPKSWYCGIRLMFYSSAHHTDCKQMNPVELRRIEPARNMYRFYRLDIQLDLFGGVRLLRQWGRIGGRGGRIKIAHYENDALAADALQH
jgi:predicted DNA-binding WGR domain protein